MVIKDNFLDKEKFDALQNIMLGDNFSWFYYSSVVYENEISDKFGFIHGFYKNNAPDSPYAEILNPVIATINPLSVWRIKANLLTRTSSIVEQIFHTDMFDVPEEKLKQWTTSIFYINTNNGYTEFEDGTKVESVANRFVNFPANLKHRGTSCTDQKTRVVINFNYFK